MNEVKQLVEQLNEYRNSYYNDNYSMVSDKEYDLLFDRLCELEKTTGIIYANSPTVTVGYEVVSQLKKVKHDHPLLSLAKETDVKKFADYFGNKKVMVMAKMDGLTCSLHYKDGKLMLAESRGDGHIGEDITHNVLTFTNLPTTIPYRGEIIIDGECIIDYDTFDKINKPLIDKAAEEAKRLGLEDKEYKEYMRKHSYANPRNLASGSVRQLDSKIAASRELKFIAWKLYKAYDTNGNLIPCNESYSTAFDFLKDMGFEVAPYEIIDKCNTLDMELMINSLHDKCLNLKYPIDGIVAAFDDVEYGVSLGTTGHHPKHSLAYKFSQEDNETVLLDIEWNTSRTGLVNPVAVVEPVEIDGTTVSRATLSNVSIIKELQLGIGDTITMIKAHQIIPQITDNLTRSDTYIIPDKCPCCNSPLIIKNDNGREMLYCTNDECLAIRHDKIANFASREGLNIVGISEERLKLLMNLGFITDFASLYSLHKYRSDIEQLDGFGKISAEKLLNAIEVSKDCKFVNVVVAIGVPGIGKSYAKSIAKHCAALSGDESVLAKFIELATNDYDWSCLEDFGELTSKAVNEYIKKNKRDIAALIPILNIVDDTEQNYTNIFGGKTFCITGKLNIYDNREKLVEEIEKYGGKIVSGVTSKTNYLITNDTESGSSKNKKALQYGTTIISEADFVELIKQSEGNN